MQILIFWSARQATLSNVNRTELQTSRVGRAGALSPHRRRGTPSGHPVVLTLAGRPTRYARETLNSRGAWHRSFVRLGYDDHRWELDSKEEQG